MGKLHKCGYSHCLHPGLLLSDEEAVKEGKTFYHWDCLQLKNDIKEIRDIYMSRIDKTVSIPILAKVINDLVFKYNQPTDYIKYAINHYADYGIKIKSPFTLLYIRNNAIMKQKYERDGGRNC